MVLSLASARITVVRLHSLCDRHEDADSLYERMSEREAIAILKTVRKASPEDSELIDSRTSRSIDRKIAGARCLCF